MWNNSCLFVHLVPFDGLCRSASSAAARRLWNVSRARSSSSCTTAWSTRSVLPSRAESPLRSCGPHAVAVWLLAGSVGGRWSWCPPRERTGEDTTSPRALASPGLLGIGVVGLDERCRCGGRHRHRSRDRGRESGRGPRRNGWERNWPRVPTTGAARFARSAYL